MGDSRKWGLEQQEIEDGDFTETNQFDGLTHRDMVAKLAKPGADIIESLTAPRADLWHHVTGVVTEAGELLTFTGAENLVEELGDMEFYLCGVYINLQIDRAGPQVLPNQQADMGALMFWSTELLDATKKVTIYAQEPDVPRFTAILMNLEQELEKLRRSQQISRDDTLAANMSKLFQRYPGFVYNDVKAKERADKTTH